MASDHKDYSSTPLATKLGIREDSRVLLVNAPEGFTDLLRPLPTGVKILARTGRALDVAVVFAVEHAALGAAFQRVKPALASDGRLWVAWPKKASRVPTDISFELAQRLGLDAGLVDNKSAGITDVYQGLRFVYRVRDRTGR